MLLRLLGFIPAVVHTAWAQVLLARVETAQWRSLAVGLGAAATRQLWQDGWAFGAGRHFACHRVAGRPTSCLWCCGGSACISAALQPPAIPARPRAPVLVAGHGAAGFATGGLVAPLWAPRGWSAEVHLWWLAGTSAIGLLVLSPGCWRCHGAKPPFVGSTRSFWSESAGYAPFLALRAMKPAPGCVKPKIGFPTNPGPALCLTQSTPPQPFVPPGRQPTHRRTPEKLRALREAQAQGGGVAFPNNFKPAHKAADLHTAHGHVEASVLKPTTSA